VASPAQPTPDRRAWLLGAAILIFIVHASAFLYFFVDDEGIPLVYAQHLLHGQGLIYNSIEGRVEGYSDFLHVIINTGLLAIVTVLRAPKIVVFFLGKGLSLLAGVGTIVLTFLTLQRLPNIRPIGVAAGLAVLVTAGPFALWAASSLETVPFAFLVMLLMFALQAGSGRDDGHNDGRADVMAFIAAALICLERLDGPIYVGALLGAFLIFSDRSRRAALGRRVVLPLIAVLLAYHGWRRWYFGDWLNMPIYAKLMFKLSPRGGIVTKLPDQPYWHQLVALYGWPAVIVLVGGSIYGVVRERATWPIVLAIAASVVYASRVGDWMFGLRFFVVAFPLVAILVAQIVSALSRVTPRIAIVAAIVIAAWCGDRAFAFERSYEVSEHRRAWLAHPSGSVGDYFSPYYELLTAASARIGRGARVAYNQAGFLPFMLELDNIDDLGICSRFYAKLPTRDVFFTEVGRYATLKAGPSVRAPEAFLLYHDVPFLIQRNDLLRNANDNTIPQELIGGYYALAQRVGSTDTIYARTPRDASEYRRDPRLFAENLAHVANLSAAAVDGQPVAVAQIPEVFPFLREGMSPLRFTGTSTFDVQFGDADLDVLELDVSLATAADPVSLTFELQSVTGEGRYTARLDLERNVPRALMERIPGLVRAGRLHVTVSGPPHRSAVWLRDVRVLGQTPELAAYITKELNFPVDP
jgi:hypothetical protein